MTNLSQLPNMTTQLLKAIDYLDYSHNKIINLPDEPSKLDQETLETWESYSARFARVADIFMAKYIRAKILEDDPAFRGSFRDFLNAAVKQGLISDVDTWMLIRGLRNISAHEYTDKDLREFFLQLKKHTPQLIALKELVSK